ncbi:MAG: sigma-70 family RNA polymerase sigma factor [Candidatus Pseudobacter hemicellulosilyticus]|uniref:Sigma-70 family RNA polymerase sigma factor n=1 Tax=Candidatus Pseudobacter hemicellulosilyticus TaxID=3121375 RepID=A0AAJ5WZQ9_9BACT|nr:MAG: sigma-70 family RNA polymerase sigma factor [Pseudobacter sp.]
MLRQFILGDEAAFRQVFLRQLNPLCYFAEKIIGQRQEAEDMVSAAFYKLWQRHADFSSLAGIRSFLYTTVRNQCFDHLKHRAVVDAAADRLPVQLSDAGIEARMYQAELLQLIYEGMEQLTAKHRHILQWSFLEELPTAEIASRLRMTETHVRVEKSRALVQLRQALRSKQRWQEALVLLAAWQLH